MVSSFLVVLDFLVCVAVDFGNARGWASGIVLRPKGLLAAHNNDIGPPCSNQPANNDLAESELAGDLMASLSKDSFDSSPNHSDGVLLVEA